MDNDETFVSFITARTGMMWIEEQERVEQSLRETEIPFLFIEAEKDEVVSNTHIKAAYETAKEAGKQNDYLTIRGKFSDHTVITVDPVYASPMMKGTIKYFNRIVEEK